MSHRERRPSHHLTELEEKEKSVLGQFIKDSGFIKDSCPLQRGRTVTTVLTDSPPPDFNIYLLRSILTIRKDDKRILSSHQTPSASNNSTSHDNARIRTEGKV